MKKVRLFLLITVFSFCSVFVYGQQKQITRKEFYDEYYSSLNKTNKLTRREKINRKFFLNEKLIRTDLITDEFVPPDNQRHFIETKTGEKTIVTSERITSSEYVKIGKNTYYRRDNGEWKRGAGGIGSGSGSGGGKTESEKFTVEKTNYNNQTVKLYQNTFVYTDSSNQKTYLIIKIWINKDGVLLKQELEDGIVEPKRRIKIEVKDFEYASDIKIEVPKID